MNPELKLKRVKVSYDILMPVDDVVGDMDLDGIYHECMHGSWSGRNLKIESEEILTDLTKIQAACHEHATDLEFFFDEDDLCELIHRVIAIDFPLDEQIKNQDELARIVGANGNGDRRKEISEVIFNNTDIGLTCQYENDTFKIMNVDDIEELTYPFTVMQLSKALLRLDQEPK